MGEKVIEERVCGGAVRAEDRPRVKTPGRSGGVGFAVGDGLKGGKGTTGDCKWSHRKSARENTLGRRNQSAMERQRIYGGP